MSYNAFLMIASQVTHKKSARVIIEDQEIYIEMLPKTRWRLSTKIFDGDGSIPKSVTDCVSASGVLRWQEQGAYLKMDSATHSVFLVQEISSPFRYIPFKSVIDDFLHVASEWRIILVDRTSVFR